MNTDGLYKTHLAAQSRIAVVCILARRWPVEYLLYPSKANKANVDDPTEVKKLRKIDESVMISARFTVCLPAKS